mmetsp:Transcript_1255/g.1897  ORF Transcript_1255/g.1897 Transcript_1255/m.1897 type:complete len:343 (-) Transcript_1255:1088-2116(-)
MLTKRLLASLAKRSVTRASHRCISLSSSTSSSKVYSTRSRFYSTSQKENDTTTPTVSEKVETTTPVVEEEQETKRVQPVEQEEVTVVAEEAVDMNENMEVVEEEEEVEEKEPLPDIMEDVLTKSYEFHKTPKYIESIIADESLADANVEQLIRDEVEEYASHLLNIRPPVYDHHLGTVALKFNVVQATEDKYNMRFPAKVLQNIQRVSDVVDYVVYTILSARAAERASTVEHVPSNISSFLEHARRREFITRERVVGAISKQKRKNHNVNSFFKANFELSENEMRVMEDNARAAADKEIFEKRYIRRKPSRFWRDGVTLGKKTAPSSTIQAFLNKDYVKKED